MPAAPSLYDRRLMTSEPLLEVDAYLDAVLHPTGIPEDLGSLRLFVTDDPAGWPYYARPIPGGGTVSRHNVERVLARQRELGVPETFEWLHEVTPSMTDATREAGLRVDLYPLLVCQAADLLPVGPPRDAVVRMAGPDDDLGVLAAVARAGFEVPGTQVADRSLDEVARFRAEITSERVAFKERRYERGLIVPALAKVGGAIVAVGFHQPIGSLSEIVGLATLPAYRRRGLGAAVTSVLASNAFERGVETVLLSAGDDDVARLYERLGFRRVGRVGAAEPRID